MKRPIARPIKMSQRIYLAHVDNDEGICLYCGTSRGNCEPDAKGYPCDDCGRMDVYGVEELLAQGEIEITS